MRVSNKKMTANVSVEGVYGFDNMHGMRSFMESHGWKIKHTDPRGNALIIEWTKEFEDMLDMLVETEYVQDLFNTGCDAPGSFYFVSPMPTLPDSMSA